MGCGIVFWIVCGCLIFSLCESLWRSFRAIRNSETKHWTSIQAIVVLGVGITLRELMQCWQFSEAMGLYDYSSAANLISIVIICSVAFEFLFAAYEYFKPTMYLPMSPSDIEDWKERHQAELSGTTEEENNKDNTDTEPKDE